MKIWVAAVLLGVGIILGCGDDEPTSSGDTTPPAAVTNLVATSIDESSVALTWAAPGDDGDEGMASEYDVRYSTLVDALPNWWDSLTMAVENVAPPQAAGESETLNIEGLMPDTTYYFALKTADEVPNWSDLSNVAHATMPPLTVPQMSDLPDTLDFGTAVVSLKLAISNVGAGTLTWSVSDDAAWLDADSTSGSTTTETDTITVTVDRSGLPPDTYTGHVYVSSDGGADTVLVSMEVAPQPELSVSPTTLAFGESTTNLNFEISNIGTGTLTWSITDDRDWIVVDPTSGGTTIETDEVTATVDRTGLDSGTYTGTISITSNGGNATVSISIEVHDDVTPEPGDWSGTAEFGQLGFTVNDQSTAITQIRFTFQDWHCGGVIRNGTIITSNPTGWPISNGEFTIETSYQGELSMTVQGAFSAIDAASGTWTGVSYGNTCPGGWQAGH